MQLFLIRGTVRWNEYGEDDSKTTDELRIVEAENIDTAKQKFLKHFNDQTEEYYLYVYVEIEHTSAVIR